MRPLGGGALLAPGRRAPGADVGERVGPRRRGRCLGVGAPDVDARVVVAAAHPGAAVRLDVDRRGRIELRGAGAVAHLPDLEELGQPAPVADGQRRPHGVERVRERARDLVLVEVRSAPLDVARALLQPRVVVGRDAEAEDVDRLRLAAEPRGELLRHEGVGPVGERERAVDRVVVGERDEVHAPALGQRVGLLGRRRALGQPERPLDAEPRALRGRRVDVQVEADRAWIGHLVITDSLHLDRFL